MYNKHSSITDQISMRTIAGNIIILNKMFYKNLNTDYSKY